MNLPNKLTMLRILLIPVFMLVLYWGFPGATWAALAVFVIASLTDLLDGKIARKYNLVTDFGKFADPLADKCLVTAAMLWFVEIGQMPAWALLIVIVREFAVSGLRMIASDKGRVIAAGWSGKLFSFEKHGKNCFCRSLNFPRHITYMPNADNANGRCNHPGEPEGAGLSFRELPVSAAVRCSSR